MAVSPLGGPGFGQVWDSINNGNVAGNTLSTQTGTLASNTTITGLGTAISVVKGQLVTGTGVPTPDFVSATTASATAFAVITATTTSSAQTITVQNLPVLIGGEWSTTIAAGGALTSSYWNGTGTIRPSVDTNQALYADLAFLAGGAVTPALGQSLNGWFLESYDGGTTFESAIATASTVVAAVSRAPDFIVPFDNAAYATGNLRFAPGVRLPSVPFKTIVQNQGTVALPANCALIAIPITPAT
jgi:hypothetical protein